MHSVTFLDEPISRYLTRFVQKNGVDRMLRAIRKSLGMDVAFISNFRTNSRLFVTVDSGTRSPVASGSSLPIDDGYCLKVATGDLPSLIVDAGTHPVARQLPATAAVPIGSHLSVPIVLESGEVYGTLCCFSFKPHPFLGERDLRVLSAFADVLAERLDENLAEGRDRHLRALIIKKAMREGKPRIVYQPMFDVRTGNVVGMEALSRFEKQPHASPELWFKHAADSGMGVELETHCIAKAIGALDVMPEPTTLAVNASPETILSGKIVSTLEGVNLKRLVLEITEHATVGDYDKLHDELAPLRAAGVRLAVDDAGAGYASMRHILQLKPEIIKLDMSLTRSIDTDLSKRALARGLISFAKEIGTRITAEGVETLEELNLLRSLGVDKVQGYLLAKPLPLEEALLLLKAPPPAPFTASREVPS